MLRIKEAREARGWTQERLASEINTTQQTVQRWESGQTDPKSSTIKDISKALGITVSFIMNVNEDGEPANLTFEKASMWSEDANKTIRTPSSKDVRTRSIWLTTHGFIRTCIIGGRIAVIIERAA